MTINNPTSLQIKITITNEEMETYDIRTDDEKEKKNDLQQPSFNLFHE